MPVLRHARVLTLVIFAAIGCDDSNANPEPDDTTISTSHGSTSASVGGKGGSSSGAAGAKASGAGGSTSASAGGKSGSSSNASGDDAGMSVPSQATNADECKTGMSGCFCGAPMKDPDFLNQCSAAMCNPFDNSKLKKRNADGTLPPIP